MDLLLDVPPVGLNSASLADRTTATVCACDDIAVGATATNEGQRKFATMW